MSRAAAFALALALLALAACAGPPQSADTRIVATRGPGSDDGTATAPYEPPSSELTVPPLGPPSPGARRLLRRKQLHLPPPPYLLASALTRVPSHGRRIIVLTLDDGPGRYTEAIVRILERNRAHATFFFVGRRCLGRSATLRAVLAQGSEIGNHTMDHVSLLGTPIAWDEYEIERAEDVYVAEAGVRPVWVRPQAGWADRTGIEAIAALHKRWVFWDDFGDDTVTRFTARQIEEAVLEKAQPGAIVLLHETSPRTVEALPRLLARLRERGYEVVTLTAAMQ